MLQVIFKRKFGNVFIDRGIFLLVSNINPAHNLFLAFSTGTGIIKPEIVEKEFFYGNEATYTSDSVLHIG